MISKIKDIKEFIEHKQKNLLKMVLKRSNCGVNSGNTMRPRYYNTYQPKATRENHIMKFYFNSIIQPADFEYQNEEIKATFEEYLDDGDFPFQTSFHSPVVYSLNKRKRWSLPEIVKGHIGSERLREERFKVTLCENEDYTMPWYSAMFRTRGNCTEYWDSKNAQPCSFARKHLSYMSDLRRRGQDNAPREKPSRRRPFHNKHKTGIQRPHLYKRPTPQPQENHSNILGNLAERGGCPEIRYEIKSPARYDSSRRYYPYQRISKKWCEYYLRNGNKSLCKSKGLRNKPGTGDIFRGYGLLDMKEALEYALDYPAKTVVKSKIQLPSKKKTTKSQKFLLKTLISQSESIKKEKSFCKKEKKRKKKMKISENDAKGGFVFVDVKNKVQKKVEVLQISRASSKWTKKYGKGCAIYEEKKSQTQEEEDYVIVEEEEEELESKEDPEAMEVLLDSIRMFNDTFCVCKMFMNEIVPRKLVEVCGSKVEVSFVHPYTFVLDLGSWFLICQMSPGVGLWPDPGSQSVISVRVMLQGGESEIESINANTMLHREILDQFIPVYKLSELIEVTKQILEGLKPSRKRISMSPPAPKHKTIYQQLFADLTVVQTSREVFEAHERSLNLLPSVARIDLVELIEIDLGLVEECSICNASWEGDGWSWVSHNVTLVSCKHSFCRQCWQIYLCHSIRQGQTTLHCMEYECTTEIDAATVASLVPMKLYTRWQQQRAEKHLTQEGGWEWCPRPGCQYLAKNVKPKHRKTPLQCRYGFTVRCHCGELWCFLCKKEPHWPALCSHSNMYHKMLLQNGDDHSKVGSYDQVTYFVKFKKCPKCNYPMEKSGGCSHMTCRCKHHFCWECLVSWDEHVNNGLACSQNQKDLTTMELDDTVYLALPVCYYKDSVAHRHARQILSSTVNKRAAQYTTVQKSTRHWTRNPMSAEPDPTQLFVRNTLLFVSNIHNLLEYCSVLLSNTTRACRPQSLVACRSQLAFIASRIEATLNVPKSQRDKMLTRLKSLQYMAWTIIDKLVILVPQSQELIDSYHKRREQEVEGSTGEGADN